MPQVDEGIEAMLCCWLQQLQEFGGPEVDKPDLLKGSIGSLKNLGLANNSNAAAAVAAVATTATTTNNTNPTNATAAGGTVAAAGAATFKPTSNTSSLLKHKSILDMRARYNVRTKIIIQLMRVYFNICTQKINRVIWCN